ncbi:MAG: esterase family protein, partial [Clostridiales bacterium]|nr:esterase family protein [Clostridiales bacterium]
MDSVKGLINTTPDSSVFTKKDGVTYGTVRSLTYYSQTAERETPVNVILPPNYTEDKEYPVLYILH